MDRDDQPPPLPGHRARAGGGGCLKALLVAGSAVALLAALGVGALVAATSFGYIPDTELRSGERLSERIRERVAEVALEEGESVVWFYSAALLDAGEDGNLLTDRRVVSYWTQADSDERIVEAIPLSGIGRIEVDFSGSFLTDTELHVWPAGATDADESVLLLLSAETDLDHAFVHDLVRLARAAGAEIESIAVEGAREARDLELVVEDAAPAD